MSKNTFVIPLSLLLLSSLACRSMSSAPPAPADSSSPAPSPTAQTDETETAPTVQTAIQLLLQQQKPAEARDLLERIVAEDPENARAFRVLGRAHAALEDYGAALGAYETATRLQPDAQQGAYLQAGMLARLGSADRAFEILLGLREAKSYDLSAAALDPHLASLTDDPRFASLGPTDEEIHHPFVEPTRVLHEWVGEAANDQFGWIARNMGDADGDGIDDAVLSAPTAGEGQAGRIYAFSGSTGELLWTHDGEPGDQLGIGVEAAGDVDGDGIPDAAAGGPGGDVVRILSGTDGSVLLTLKATEPGEGFGRHVHGLGDLDGDGHSDILVGAPQFDGARGRAAVYSGRDGAILREWKGEETGDRMGETVGARLVEGTAWLVIGAPDAGDGDRGRVYVHRGLESEAPHFIIDSDQDGSELGRMFVSVVGDVDADGTPDVYASDWSHGPGGEGKAVVHSGADGRELYAWTGEEAGEGFGIGVADAGDVDRDGHDDIAVGAWQHGSAAPGGGRVTLYSGLDGSVVRTWTSRTMGETFGFDTTNLGDVDGDGIVDQLITSAWSPVNGPRSGRVFVISGGD